MHNNPGQVSSAWTRWTGSVSMVVCSITFYCFVSCTVAHAGGPRFVAGTSYFDPAVVGKAVLWPGGVVSYFVDQGDLSKAVDHATAAATVAAAAASWNAVPTAAVLISQGGTLAEDVSGANVLATASGIVMPADILPSAIAKPVAVIFDADGAVIDALYGLDASDPDDCVHAGVLNRVDNLATDGTILHASILVNGRCTGTPAQLNQIEFQLIRAFGRVLGLDWSQANDAVLTGPSAPSPQQLEGWPAMRPVDLNCDQLSTECVPDPLQLRPDDTAALSRLYPVTAANQAQYPQKTQTAASTLSIHGVVRFRRGQGMHGVNVVARPIQPGLGLPDNRYPVAAVTGFLFTGNAGNPINGFSNGFANTSADPSGIGFGSTDPLVEGSYDLSGIPLPPGQTSADYQLTLEAVNPLYTGLESVGPYTLGSPTPSGTMPVFTLEGLTAGMSVEQDFTIEDSAGDLQGGLTGTATAPAAIPVSGDWQGRVAAIGEAEWLAFPVQGGRHFTIEAQALDAAPSPDAEETVVPTQEKLRPVLGIWNATGMTTELPAVATLAPYNGAALGVTTLGVDAIADGEVVLGIADQRGDGRPDYGFRGRLLYAASVSPTHLPLAGGTITITGEGFRPGMVVSLGGQIMAAVIEITPYSIVANAPAVPAPTGSLDLVLTDPATNGIAAIAAGISYGVGSEDTMSVAAALGTTVEIGVPASFTVRVFGPDQVTPVGGVPVVFSVLKGAASLPGCAQSPCSVVTTGDGYATVAVLPTRPGVLKLQAALSNGTTLASESTAIPLPGIAALTPPLLLAPDSTWSWTPEVQLASNVRGVSGALVDWSGQGAPASVPPTSPANSAGIAFIRLTVGPWAAGTTFTLSACAASSGLCAALPVYVVHPEAEALMPISGVAQQLAPGSQPLPVTFRLIAPGGQPIVGGNVQFTGALRAWTPPCSSAGPCPPGRLIATFSQTAVSAADGSATLSPAAIPELVNPPVPLIVTGLAMAGAGNVPAASQAFEIDGHP